MNEEWHYTTERADPDDPILAASRWKRERDDARAERDALDAAVDRLEAERARLSDRLQEEITLGNGKIEQLEEQRDSARVERDALRAAIEEHRDFYARGIDDGDHPNERLWAVLNDKEVS